MKKSRYWTIDAETITRFECIYDIPVTQEEAVWQFESGDDNLFEIESEDVLETFAIKKVRKNE